MVSRRELDTTKRSSFIFHCAGHGGANNNGDLLTLALKDPDAYVDDIPPNETREFAAIKDNLVEASKRNFKMDVPVHYGLLSCSGWKRKWFKTKQSGVHSCYNFSRADGLTFTTAWCNAFYEFFNQGKPFYTQDIVEKVNLQRGL